MRSPVWRSLVLLAVGAMLASVLSSGCGRCSDPGQSSSVAEPAKVLLAGPFDEVAKPARGSAELIATGTHYQLRLRAVTVDDRGPVHVYFVGVPAARTTLEVVQTDTKYDFGPLRTDTAQQIIDLPSEPAPELRSVVLWNRLYGVNLAVAALQEIEE
jgi:hypothetical protein